MTWNVRIEIPVGAQFGKWTVTGEPVMHESSGGNKFLRYPVVCTCGATGSVRSYPLRNGFSKSCRKCRDNLINGGNFLGGSANPRFKGVTVKRQKDAWIRQEKSQPCVDCGRSFPPYCMEFDHVPERGPKEFAINLNMSGSRRTLEELQVERAKCDLVCAICHNHRTWLRNKKTPVPLWVLPEIHWIKKMPR